MFKVFCSHSYSLMRYGSGCFACFSAEAKLPSAYYGLELLEHLRSKD